MKDTTKAKISKAGWTTAKCSLLFALNGCGVSIWVMNIVQSPSVKAISNDPNLTPEVKQLLKKNCNYWKTELDWDQKLGIWLGEIAGCILSIAIAILLYKKGCDAKLQERQFKHEEKMQDSYMKNLDKIWGDKK